MSLDITFHYPPELFNLLVDVIPLLNRSKKDVFIFFQGAGVKSSLMKAPHDAWSRDRKCINKYEIARQVLVVVNQHGERTLRERREVLRRVVEFNSFSSCWPADQLKAKGLVAEIQSVVNVKDSFTRMNQEREKERQSRIEDHEREISRRQAQMKERGVIKTDLYALFGETDAIKRANELEGVLNRLFKSYGILVREAFRRRGNAGEGVVEQIDGVVEFDGNIYLVEMKWWQQPIGVPEVSQHLVRVYHRDAARGILISHSGFTEPAITTCRDALQKSVFVLATLQEIVLLLESDKTLIEFLRKKVQAAVVDKQPFVEQITV